jgi:hypothetical protein
VHVGQATYYKQLQTMPAELEAAGAIIQYENIGSAPDKEARKRAMPSVRSGTVARAWAWNQARWCASTSAG